MIFQRYADLFEICLPIFWPWLWLQLMILCAQKAEDGRERLIMGTWWGKVYLLAVGSAPSEPSAAPNPNTIFTQSLTARFPGDTSALIEHEEPSPLPPLQIAARCTLAALPIVQDKTHILEPG
ncbi:MAG: hypothetical protein AAGI14_09550 [Pseudomonadota bacterium]